MKIKFLLGLALLLAGFVTPILAQQDEDVRGAFMTTRPKSTPQSKNTTTTRPNRRRPKPVVKKDQKTDVVVKNDDKKTTAQKLNLPRIGLGLTLFMRDSNGLSVRTDPTHEFRKGDHVRFLIETNADGYLYVFNTTDGGAPVMIYPDPETDEAGNYFQAHVPFEIPSSLAAEERFRWFTFDDKPGTEKLFFVFTREPLGAVPMEDDLITFCRENKAKCPWHPGDEVWARIEKELSEPLQVARAAGFGKTQTDSERSATTRGIGLNRDDPEPSLIMLTASTARNMLVVALDLVHLASSD